MKLSKIICRISAILAYKRKGLFNFISKSCYEISYKIPINHSIIGNFCPNGADKTVLLEFLSVDENKRHEAACFLGYFSWYETRQSGTKIQGLLFVDNCIAPLYIY